ncbi:Maltase [Trichinella spiralis]|uniref:alpha-glucosidase n=4 Tax=Trichinella TaxID=6333 RepID=A0ABR3L1Y5_TRISP
MSSNPSDKGQESDRDSNVSSPAIREWWKSELIYQIYPRSFKDSSGNGVGDIAGITESLEYFEWLGVKAIWLSPVYKSPMIDFGYDICDFRQVDPLFGTNADLKKLVTELHNRGMYLIMDLVPNHTSDQHPWFEQSKRKQGKYADYYIWVDGKPCSDDQLPPEPPNNWESVFGGSAWTWCAERKQFYLHQFLKEQPDLNYRNADVKSEMEQVLQFWLEFGVDGFRVDAVIYLVEDKEFRDNPLVGRKRRASGTEDCRLTTKGNHTEPKYNVDQPETYEIVQSWTELMKKFGLNHKKTICCVTEGYSDIEHVMRYYSAGVSFPFNFGLLNWTAETTADELVKLVLEWQEHKPTDGWSNWVLGNHDKKRVATRLGGSRFTNMANTLLLLLPGTATCYYGDELGMEDTDIPFEKGRDSYGLRAGPERFKEVSRDPCRSPVAWISELPHYGFTKADCDPWLPHGKNAKQESVDKQRDDHLSHLCYFRRLIQLRSSAVFAESSDNFQLVPCPSQTVFAFTRFKTGSPTYVIVLNLNRSSETVCADLSAVDDHISEAEVVLDSNNHYKPGESMNLKRLMLNETQALVLRFQPSAQR